MAAGATYTPIATQTVTGSAVNGITFTSIPQTYTDLRFVISGRGDSNSYMPLKINNDSSTLYSRTNLIGNGTTASSGRATGEPAMFVDTADGSNASAVGTTIVDMMNYSNTTTFKTSLERASNSIGASLGSVISWVFLYRSTNAITSLYFTGSSGSSIQVGTTITLYGIAAA